MMRPGDDDNDTDGTAEAADGDAQARIAKAIRGPRALKPGQKPVKAGKGGIAAKAGQAGAGKGAGKKVAANKAPTVNIPHGETAAESPEWRAFVGHWLEMSGCKVESAPRGDWEIDLSEALQKRWRRQRVRLVFDPSRSTVPRGAWFTAPGSTAGRRILEAALDAPMFTRRTALAQVPGAPANGIASVCKARGLTWGTPRLGPVRYERRVAFHAVITRWGGLPWQEQWVVLVGTGGEVLERDQAPQVPNVRPREGLYQMGEELEQELRERWLHSARQTLEALAAEREREWEITVSRLRDDELDRMGAFFAARIEEEEDRQRRRTHDDPEMDTGDATSLKLEWERRAAEVRKRWEMRTEVRLWGLEEWSWPVADLEQELKSGAMHVKVRSLVDVARGKPALPACPTCGAAAEMLVRAKGHVACAQCAR